VPDRTQLQTVPCSLCGSRDHVPLFERPYAEETLLDCATFAASTDEFSAYGRIVRCKACGLVFVNPRPTHERLLAGYSACVDASYLEESSSRSINAHLSLRTIAKHARAGRLLDVGCATGYFLNAARVDFEVVGLEPCEWACRICRDRFKLEAYPETLQADRFAPESFDVVTLIDVLEHLADPKAAVLRAARLLKPGGLLYIVTPDIESLSAKLLRGYWWGLRPAHMHYFSPATLECLLAEASARIVRRKSFGRIFSYGYWCSRLKNYPSWTHSLVRPAITLLGIEDKLLYLDTRDSIEVCALKR